MYDMEQRARMLCRSICRAAMCERLGKCLDSYPGCGGQLNRFFPQLRKADELLAEAEAQ